MCIIDCAHLEGKLSDIPDKCIPLDILYFAAEYYSQLPGQSGKCSKQTENYLSDLTRWNIIAQVIDSLIRFINML